MEFTEFAQILKLIIGGSYSTHVFARTLFETIITEDGVLQIEDISDNTFKAYYNGKTKTTKIAQRVLPHIDPEQFISYLDEFPEATTQRLCDAFKAHIEDIGLYNASEKISYLFESILISSAAQKRKSTPKSATDKDKTQNDILNQKTLAPANVCSSAIENLADELDEKYTPSPAIPNLIVENLCWQDTNYLKQFRAEAKPILEYCIENDPSAGETKLILSDEISNLIQHWQLEYREIEDASLRLIVEDIMQVLGDYTYYISDKFLCLIPDRGVLWFRNESLEEGEQLRNVLQPESYRLRCEIRDLYLRLYPLPDEEKSTTQKDNKTHSIKLPEQQPSEELPYSSEDNLLLQEFTTDYDEIMFTLIGENYGASLIDMTLPYKIQDLYISKWSSKADNFLDPTLKSYVFGLLGELNNISNSFLVDSFTTLFFKSARTKIRNLYVKLHPDLFAGVFPYEAFIDDWNDGEF